MKKCILFLLLITLLAGCANAAPDESQPANTPTSVSTEAPTEAPTEGTPVDSVSNEPDLTVNEQLSNIWRIMDNECVEEISILPGLLLDDIEDWMDETPFKEIKLHQRTHWDSVRVGTFGDVAVAQISMLEGDNLTGEELVWNVRMEKSDALKNKTAITIPEDADSSDIFIHNTSNQKIYGKGYFWENGDGTCTEMDFFYFEDTGNLYTFYSNELTFTQSSSNSTRSPYVVLNYIEADGDDYYDWPNYDAVLAGQKSEEPIISCFRISCFGEERTYQYQVGMNLYQWVFSEYNTDGWTTSAWNDGIIVSPDGRYSLAAQRYPWRVVRVNLENTIPSETIADTSRFHYASAYRTDVESELVLEGFYLNSPTFRGACTYSFGMHHLCDSFSFNETILISGAGVTSEELADMELIVIPHTDRDKMGDDYTNDQTHNTANGWPYGNNYATVKQNGTLLETEYRDFDTLLEQLPYVKDIHIDPGYFVADYQPKEDPNFSPYRDVDIAVAYKGQIVYWVFLPQFYDN